MLQEEIDHTKKTKKQRPNLKLLQSLIKKVTRMLYYNNCINKESDLNPEMIKPNANKKNQNIEIIRDQALIESKMLEIDVVA